MANLTGVDVFSSTVRRLEPTDPKHADTWNPVNQALLNNTTHLKGKVDEALASISALEGEVAAIAAVGAVPLNRAIRTDWLYAQNRIDLEIFSPDWTMDDLGGRVAVQNGVQGDDSLDVADTSRFVVGEEYVLFDGTHRETVTISQILTANRVRLTATLAHAYAAGAFIARTDWTVNPGSASAADGGVWLSRPVNMGNGAQAKAVVIRRADNAAVLRLYFKDATHSSWTESPWEWKRTGGVIPAEFADYEYLVGAVGAFHLKVVAEGVVGEVGHLVAVTAETGLDGAHNPPATPVNSSPANAATGLQERPTLALAAYSSPTGAAQGGVRFIIQPAGGGGVTYNSGDLPAGLSHQIPAGALAVNTAYQYMGKVKDVRGGWSGYSTATTFTTAASFVYVVAPGNASPTNGQTDLPAQPTLSSSAFAVAGGSDTHAASQWQIRTAAGSYANPLHDSGEDATDKTSHTIPADLLQAGGATYFWRVRHKGTTHGWSEWSGETSFATKANFASIIGIALAATGGGSGTWVRVDEHGDNKFADASFFNGHPVYSGIQAATIDSQSMVKIPAFYFKSGTAPEGSSQAGKSCWWISDQPSTGFSLHPAFKNAGADLPQFYVGAYEATNEGGTKAGSVASVAPLVSLDIATFKTRCAARNTGGVSGFMLWDVHQLAAVQLLCLIETGGTDVQTVIGSGNTNTAGAQNTGATNAVWRGLHELWGNTFTIVDGMTRDAASGTWKLFDSDGNRTWVNTSAACLWPTPGWVLSMHTGSGSGFDLGGVFFPASFSSTQNDGSYADYWGGGDVTFFHGGYYASQSQAGLFNLSGSSEAASGAHIGGRLAKI